MSEKMNEGNLGEMMVMVGIIETPTGPVDVLILDTMDTRGIPNNDCCGRDPNQFACIGNSIEMDGIPPYGEDFGPGHPKWDEWCKAQKESYERCDAEYDKAWA